MPEAVQDLSSIQTYIELDSVVQAHQVIMKIILFTETRLQTFPLSGRKGRVLGTLELVVPKLPYFVPYRIHNNTVELLRVYHTSRLVPEHFG